MNDLISKWTSMVTTTTSGLTTLLAAVAILALICVIILAVATKNDTKKAAHVQTLIWILGVVSVSAVAGALVSWAIAA